MMLRKYASKSEDSSRKWLIREKFWMDSHDGSSVASFHSTSAFRSEGVIFNPMILCNSSLRFSFLGLTGSEMAFRLMFEQEQLVGLVQQFSRLFGWSW